MTKEDILEELKEIRELVKDEFGEVDDKELELIAKDIFKQTHNQEY